MAPPTDAFAKPFYNSKIKGKRYVENLIKSVQEAAEGKKVSKAAKQTKGVEKLIEIVRKGEEIDRDRLVDDYEDIVKLFGDMQDVQMYNDLISGAETRTMEEPKVSARVVSVSPRPGLRGKSEKTKPAEKEEEAAEPAPAAAAPAPAPAPAKEETKEEIEEKEDKKEVSDEVQEAMKAVSPERRKEIEKEVRDKVDLEEFRRKTTQMRADADRAAAEAAALAPPKAVPVPAERKRPKESAILDPTPVTSVDLIPNERRSAEFKTAKQLRSDIEFFFESFPDMLEKEMREYIRVNKTSKKELARFHRKIMGKLQPSESISPEQKKVGVVISADEYIKQAINKALIDAKMMSMNPADVVELSVKGVDKKDDTESYGSYEVKKSKSGKLAAQKEPIYRYVPKVNEEQEREPRRSAGLQLRKRETLPQTAKRQVRNNPFLRTPNTSVRLKYLY